jgi:hypothetical protein
LRLILENIYHIESKPQTSNSAITKSLEDESLLFSKVSDSPE